MALLIKTNGEKRRISPKNGTDFKWEELYELIGGYIEIVRLKNDNILVVDEEGLCKEKEVNTIASILAGFTIVGDVVMCKESQVL